MLTASLLVLTSLALATALPQQQLIFGGDKLDFGLPKIPHKEFNPLDEMSGISPYHDAPGADIRPPPGCKITAASFLIRHSSIYANDDEWEDYMKPFVEKVLAARNDSNVRAIPSSSPLSFLSNWESPINEDNLEKLTEPGRADAYSFGERFRKLYGPLLPPKDLGKKHGKKDKKGLKGKKGKKDGKIEEPFRVWSASSSRDVETAKAWIRGAFPKYQEGEDGEGDGKYVSLVKVPKDSRDWSIALTPHKVCDAFSKEPGKAEAQQWVDKFTPPAVERMNRFAPGYNFVANDVIAAQMLCGYESVILKDRSSPFCSTELFTPDEFRSHGYMHDEHWHHSIGFGAKVSPYLGIGWVNASTHNILSAYKRPHEHPNATFPEPSLFSRATFSSIWSDLKKGKKPSLPPPSAPPDATHTQLLFTAFTHREEPPFALVALGLWNTTDADLPLDRMPEKRLWKTSHVIPFLGHVALERIGCSNDRKEDYVRVMVNGAPQQLPACHDGPGGSCSLDDFEAFVKERVELYKDFDGACKKEEE